MDYEERLDPSSAVIGDLMTRLRAQVQAWFDSVAVGSRRDWNDTHIDRFDAALRDKRLWVRGALEIFEIAVDLRNARQAPLSVAVLIRLQAGRSPLGVNFRTLDSVAEQLMWTPPKLALAIPMLRPWRGNKTFRSLEASYVAALPAATRAYLQEWLDPDEAEFARTLWLCSEAVTLSA